MNKLVTLLVLYIVVASAHTWLDCVKRQSDGSCAGYARGYPGRLPGVSIDTLYTYRIQPGLLSNPSGVAICEPNLQGGPNYSSRFPMGSANAGDTLTMSWTPNGHQRPAQDPKSWTLHWTGQPNTQLTTRGQMTAANTLTGALFDAECTGGAGDPCFGHFTIPSNIPSGRYSFVWYWIFNRDPNGAGEEYTTCFDIQVNGVSNPTTTSASTTQAPPATTRGTTTAASTTTSAATTGIVSTTGTVTNGNIFSSSADAVIKGGSSSNYATGTELGVKWSKKTKDIRESFLKFDLNSVSGQINSAQLVLQVDYVSAEQNITFNVGYTQASWTEGGINYMNKPTSTFYSTATRVVRQSSVSIDITQMINQLSNGREFTVHLYGITNNKSKVKFYSREAGAAKSPAIILNSGQQFALPIEGSENAAYYIGSSGDNEDQEVSASTQLQFSFVVLISAFLSMLF